MFYYLNGKLALCQPDLAVIDCAGVGYKCFITSNTYKKISGKEIVKLFTYLNVKEDSLDIYGFENEQELHFFTLLISISGVGPKVALAILSELEPEELSNCIIVSDVKRLTKAAGVGTKLAQRICLELKDKISKNKISGYSKPVPNESISESSVEDAVAVLVALGYSKFESQQAVSRCSAETTNDIVRQALRLLSKNI